MPNLAVVQKMKNGKINIFFSDYLFQSDNLNDAVMAYDKVEKQFINDPILQGITDKERYIYSTNQITRSFLSFLGNLCRGMFKR